MFIYSGQSEMAPIPQHTPDIPTTVFNTSNIPTTVFDQVGQVDGSYTTSQDITNTDPKQILLFMQQIAIAAENIDASDTNAIQMDSLSEFNIDLNSAEIQAASIDPGFIDDLLDVVAKTI